MTRQKCACVGKGQYWQGLSSRALIACIHPQSTRAFQSRRERRLRFPRSDDPGEFNSAQRDIRARYGMLSAAVLAKENVIRHS